MDLNTIGTILGPRTRADLPRWERNDAFLAGGSWLFSEPQPDLRRLIDLTAFKWKPFVVTEDGLEIAATCTIAQIARAELPGAWTAAPLIAKCCRALLGSFKVWNVATVGGNLCMALPAGPLIALTCALDGVCTIWMPEGGERRVAARDFVLGPQRNTLQPGEILRSIALPAATLRRRFASRQISLSPEGRSGALVIGTAASNDTLEITVTAAVPRPLCIVLPMSCRADELRTALDAAVKPVGWYDDVHGQPAWRAHVTHLLADEICTDLRVGATA